MEQIEQELLAEVTDRLAQALESTELQPGANAFVLSGPITLLRPENVVSEVVLPPIVRGVFRGFYAT